MYFRVDSKIFTARVPIKMKKKRVYRSIVKSVQIRFTPHSLQARHDFPP